MPFRAVWGAKEWSFSSRLGFGSSLGSGTQLWIRPVDEHSAWIGRRRDRQTREILVEAPMKSSLMAERRKQYFVEMALAWWVRELS